MNKGDKLKINQRETFMRSGIFLNCFTCSESRFCICFFHEPKVSLKFKIDHKNGDVVSGFYSVNNITIHLNYEVVCLFYLGLYAAWFVHL